MMASRHVTGTGKDQGDITALCGNFGRVSKATAIHDINNGIHRYYTNVGGLPANIRVVTVNGIQHLTTHPDGYKPNNLDNLPDC